MTKNIVAPPGGIMTDEVGVITGEVTLRPEISATGMVTLLVQYTGADEWYRVTDTALLVDPGDPDEADAAAQDLLNRFG